MKKIVLVIFISLFNTPCFSNTSTGFIPVTGGKLYYEVVGEGSPIVVVHGGPGLDHTYLLPQLSDLKNNHQIIYYDQRSSGKSLPIHLNEQFMTVEQFVEDIDSIRRGLGYKKITVIGHSWGGILAMLYAVKFPKQTQALILMNSAPASSTGFNAFLKEYQKRTKPIQGQLDAITQSQAFINAEPKAFNRYFQLLFTKYLYKESDSRKLPLNFSLETAKNQAKIGSIFSNSLFGTVYDIRPQLNHLKIPTLVIHGSQDPIPPWTAQQIATAIPKSQLAVIKEAGHFSYLEKPKQVKALIENFMDRAGVLKH